MRRKENGEICCSGIRTTTVWLRCCRSTGSAEALLRKGKEVVLLRKHIWRGCASLKPQARRFFAWVDTRWRQDGGTMAASWARAGRQGPQSGANLANVTPSRCTLRGSCCTFEHSFGRKESGPNKNDFYRFEPDVGGKGAIRRPLQGPKRGPGQRKMGASRRQDGEERGQGRTSPLENKKTRQQMQIRSTWGRRGPRAASRWWGNGSKLGPSRARGAPKRGQSCQHDAIAMHR